MIYAPLVASMLTNIEYTETGAPRGGPRPQMRLKNNHLRLSLRQGYDERDAIFFGGGANELPDPPWDIAFAVDRNFFRGRVSVQVSIQNVRAAVGSGNECE